MAGEVLVSLASYVIVYAVIVSFGVYYIYTLLRQGPTVEAKPIPGATASRPLAYAGTKESATGAGLQIGG